MSEDITKLKADAYDMISVMEQAKARLLQINNKIAELSQKEKDAGQPIQNAE